MPAGVMLWIKTSLGNILFAVAGLWVRNILPALLRLLDEYPHLRLY